MSQHRAGMAQRIGRLTAGVGGEGLSEADNRLVLGVFAGRQVLKFRQQGLGSHRVAAQSRQAAPVAGEILDVAAAAQAISEARDIAGRLRCQPLLDRAADMAPAESRMRT